MEWVVFVLVAVTAVGTALGLVIRPNPLHGALFLVANLFCVAVLYLMLRAEFLALAQVIVYAGAIAVLFVFAIMVLIPGKEETGPDPLRGQRVMAVPLVGIFLILLALVLRSSVLRQPGPDVPVPGGVEAVGRVLFTDSPFPFEVTPLLLLVAIVGVLALARRKVGTQ